MTETHGIEYHRDQFQQAMTDWLGHDGNPNADKPRKEVAYSTLEHAAAVTYLAEGSDLAGDFKALSPEEREELISAACHHANPTSLKQRLDGLIQNDALTAAELDGFDQVLRDTDKLVSVLDLSARLAAMSDGADVHAVIGEKLFELDDLLDTLYSRLDVMSVRWRVLQRPDGTIPGWLTRARELDEQLNKGEQATFGIATPLHKLIAKLIDPEDSVIRFRGEVSLTGQSPTPGTPLTPPLSATDGRLHLDTLAGAEPGSLTLEFASRDPAMANAVVGYILAQGIGGEPVAGLTVLPSKSGQEWSLSEVVVPARDMERLGAACYGITAGPVRLDQLNEGGYHTVLAVARSAVPSQATAWRAWAANLLRSTADLTERVRSDVSRLASSEATEGSSPWKSSETPSES